MVNNKAKAFRMKCVINLAIHIMFSKMNKLTSFKTPSNIQPYNTLINT